MATRKSRPAVVGLGLCVVDHLYWVDGLDLGAERTRYTARKVAAGGMVATALVQAVRSGCAARLLSVLGEDEDARLVLRSLRAAGVSTRGIVMSAKVPTSQAVVLVDAKSGERRFLVPDRTKVERRGPRLDLRAIRKGVPLLVDGHYPIDALRAVKRARKVGAPVVGDFNRPTADNLELLPYADYLIVPESFVAEYHDGSAGEALLRLQDEFGGFPIVTQGARGGLFLDGSRVRRFRSPKVKVADTTGAGDAFHGAFAAGIAQGLGFEANLTRAAKAGARACTRQGGMTAVAGRRLP
jgi:sulfofructose kinase